METVHLSLFMLLCLGVDRLSSEVLQRQKRSWIIDSFTIDEGYEGEFPYILGTIHVEKTLTFFKISGDGVDKDPKDVLEIDPHKGVITVKGPVDYEKFKELKLVFLALDKFSKVIDTRLGILIGIKDANDNPPVFDRKTYEITIQESTSQGSEVITLKATDIDSGNNQLFGFRIVSVTPSPVDVEFYFLSSEAQISQTGTGTISFKGCLDHEKAEKYTIIVEAKDRGENKQLSSSCTIIVNIEDGNNHPPVITGQTGPGKVKEGQKNVLVSRLQVTDEDTKGSAAWRAKYEIYGDTENNFKITTDPETNEGLLYVQKDLDFENSSQRNLTVSVRNEISLFSCKVVSRSTTGVWKVTRVETISGATGAGVVGQAKGSFIQVTVSVEDVNEAPIFDKTPKTVSLLENEKPGQYLETFTARDPDVANANTFVYVKGEDPADCVTVDPKTGKITTTKSIDRESVHVNNSIYIVTILAVDNGKPTMTSTATLSIHVQDKNDNVPFLPNGIFDMCQSDGPSKANITVVDLDEEPYSGPFRFKLLGDVEGKWSVEPLQGYSFNLVKENKAYSGHYDLLLEVSDLQGKTAVHNLSVTVCNCIGTERPNCHLRKTFAPTVGTGALFMIFVGILVLAGALLLVFLVSCKQQQKLMPESDSGQHLMLSNTEKQGTDCNVAFDSSNEQSQREINGIFKGSSVTKTSTGHGSSGYCAFQTAQQRIYLQQLSGSVSEASQAHLNYSQSRRKGSTEQTFSRRDLSRWSTGGLSTMRRGHLERNSMRELRGASSTIRSKQIQINSMRGSSVGHGKYSHQNTVIQRKILLQELTKMLCTLQAPGEELGDYSPHVYAEEGETENNFELDAISISDISFDPDRDLDLDFKFNTLASVCTPRESTAYSTNSSCVIEKLHSGTATLIQVERHTTKMNAPL